MSIKHDKSQTLFVTFSLDIELVTLLNCFYKENFVVSFTTLYAARKILLSNLKQYYIFQK